jgi:catechol 2,3-dioxygenase-like lactoylglutathione lyase family enzyme
MKPLKTLGLHHLALRVKNLEACKRFYTELLGMSVEWEPDADNVYLTSGNDNLALHRTEDVATEKAKQTLDHFGFILAHAEDVDSWYEFFVAQKVPIKAKPKTHRDGARSFYCADPDGNIIQMIYHPPIAKSAKS